MSDIPEKAVDAAARELAGSETDGNYRWHWHTGKATRILAAALPNLASAQPQPSKKHVGAHRPALSAGAAD